MSEANDPMAEIRQSFFIECEELLEGLQDGLQAMDDGTSDGETINIVFRAVHSIKGGAGAFGLEGLVRFAHCYETVLDGVRSDTLDVTPAALKVFFGAADHLSDIVRLSRDGGDFPTPAGDALIAQLNALLGDDFDPTAEEEEIDFQPMGLSLDLDLAAPDALPDLTVAENPCFTITFTPHADLYETGNEPYLLLRALADLGDMDVRCDTARVPSLEALAPESTYLTWHVTLRADIQEAEVQSVFEFVEGLCDVEITCNAAKAVINDATTVDFAPLPPLPEGPVPDVCANEIEPIASGAVETETAPAPSEPAKPAGPAQAKSVVRVDLDRIERLVNLVGELVINQAMLSQSLESAGLSPHSDAMNGLEEFQRLTRDIQDSVMMIRAQPVKSLFQRMARIVREASSAVDKEVRLITEGDTTEVDKTVIERLADPLTHMIRNAVDHGLEDTETRRACGKSDEGQVRLSAAHRSGRVIIEVADDGGGIDRARVQQIAIDKGLIPADATLTDTEIDNLLFLPGFSTASSVSDLSGRGVGMDVVRTAIQALGGRITTTSVPGSGTTFSISLPLTLAVLDGMVVKVADETLVLPLNLVVETLTIDPDNLDEVSPGRHVVRVRGDFVPLHDLGIQLGYRTPLDSCLGSVVLLISNEDGSRAALIVDEIIDQRQVVIKGLDDSFYRAPGIAAATILGDGQIALILDPSDIIAQAQDTGHGSRNAPRMEVMQ